MIHKDLTLEHWFSFSLPMQLANVSADVGRAIKWKAQGELVYSQQAFERAWELIYLTIKDPKNKKRLRELVLVKASLADYFMGENEFGSSDESMQNYFQYFEWLAASEREVALKLRLAQKKLIN